MKGKAGSSGLAPVVAPRASWSLIVGLIVATLREWRRRHVGRRENFGVRMDMGEPGPCRAGDMAFLRSRCKRRKMARHGR